MRTDPRETVTSPTRPSLPTGVATGIGSLPGLDIAEAVRTVLGETPDWPYLPELPARGPGADMIGRTAGLLVDLPVQQWVGRWQLADRPGIDQRRISDFWRRDLDALHDIAADHDGPLRLTCAGPWTLAAALWRRTGGAMLADSGAVRDVSESLAEGARRLVSEVQERLPRATVSLQLDEPWLPAIVAGHVATESGFDVYRPQELSVVEERLSSFIASMPVPIVVHCCAPEVPVSALRRAGASAVSLDVTLIDVENVTQMDVLGENLEAGLGLLAGVVPSTSSPVDEIESESTSDTLPGKAAADVVSDIWNRLGFSPAQLRQQVSVTPTCGLSASDFDYARQAMYAALEAAKYLGDN
ncbi:methionine synthase [Natronoglycomyces albus]|uniref:Methionine synthase n=1 Tax=Natronoglycomyces albus TaxID=2811108 RepID=A0A895XTC9_9ACTN|nr:methionine synthase [Natronoglycomyces albus]QSB06545.1 methionine synthase [Natronoglycomyces albus]